MRFVQFALGVLIADAGSLLCLGTAGLKIVFCGLLALREGLVVALLHCGKTRIFRQTSQFHGLEQQRRLFKSKEDEHHRADEEDEELHRDLRQGVEQQSQAALRNRFSGEVPLHLGLIAAEVSQGEEHSTYEATPEVITIVPV